MSPGRTRALLVSVVITGMCVHVAAAAPRSKPPPPPSVADALFDEGRALLEAKRYAEACPKFAASMDAEDALGTRLNLGVCLVEWGRLQSARDVLEDTRTRALAVDQRAFAEAAEDRIASFVARIPMLQVRPARVVEGLRIVIKRADYPDQEVQPRASVALDPSGARTGAAAPTVEVSAPGFVTYTSEPIELALDQHSTIDVPALVPIANAVAGDVTPAQMQPPAESSGWSGRKKLGLGLAAGGVATLGLSVAANLNWHRAAKACSGDGRDACIEDENDKMQVYGTALFGVGVALAAVGTYLFVTGGHERQVVPMATSDGAGLAMLGTF